MANFHYKKSHIFSDIKYVTYCKYTGWDPSQTWGVNLVTEIISPFQMPIIHSNSKELMICHTETLQHHLSPAKHCGINVIPLLSNFYGGGGDKHRKLFDII
jgi:hypothetical protein